MGAEIDAHEGRFPPFAVRGAALTGITYELPVPSAQVKSCVLIAGMLADGSTTVVESAPSRDHTERLLRRARVPFEHEGNRSTVSQVDELESELSAAIAQINAAEFKPTPYEFICSGCPALDVVCAGPRLLARSPEFFPVLAAAH